MSGTSEALKVLASVQALLDSLEKELRERQQQELKAPAVQSVAQKQMSSSETQTYNSGEGSSSEASAAIEGRWSGELHVTVQPDTRESLKSICDGKAPEIASRPDKETWEKEQSVRDTLEVRKRPRVVSRADKLDVLSKKDLSTRRGFWTEQEVKNLRAGVLSVGAGKWAEILYLYDFKPGRSTVDIKDKWRNLQRSQKHQQAGSTAYFEGQRLSSDQTEPQQESAQDSAGPEKDSDLENGGKATNKRKDEHKTDSTPLKKKKRKEQDRLPNRAVVQGVAMVTDGETIERSDLLLTSCSAALANKDTESQRKGDVVDALAQTFLNPEPEDREADNDFLPGTAEHDLYVLSRSTATTPPSARCTPLTQPMDSGKKMSNLEAQGPVTGSQGSAGPPLLSRRPSSTGMVKVHFGAGISR